MMLHIDRRSALIALLVSCLSLPLPAAAFSTDQPAPPSVQFGELYHAVEMAGLFPDQKTFEFRAKLGETEANAVHPYIGLVRARPTRPVHSSKTNVGTRLTAALRQPIREPTHRIVRSYSKVAPINPRV